MKYKGIKTKILGCIVAVMTCSMLVSGLFAYLFSFDLLKKQALRDNEIKLYQNEQQISSVQKEIISISQFILIDEELQLLVRSTDNPSYLSSFAAESRLNRRLTYLSQLRDYLSGIVIVTEKGKVFATTYPNTIAGNYEKDLSGEWYQRFDERQIRSGFSIPHEGLVGPTPGRVISYVVKDINKRDATSSIAEIVIHIDLSHIQQLSELIGEGYDEFYLLDSAGQLIYSKDQTPPPVFAFPNVLQANTISSSESDNRFILTGGTNVDGWKVAAVVSTKHFQSQLRYMLSMFMLLWAGGILVIFLITLPILLNITRPITKLVGAMGKISHGELEVDVRVRSGDEMELLGNAFYEMKQDLKSYIAKSVEYEKTKRKLEMELLLSQINPHFIYNTLNTVIYLAKAQNQTPIVKLMESFISLLQDSLRVGDEWAFVSVKHEQEMVDHYALIQNYRYPGRFTLDWQVDEAVLEHRIPKTILQPLVENALFHGICNKDDEAGTIRITIGTKEERIRILVEDDGAGMDDSTIQRIFQSEAGRGKPGTHMKSIGLSNVIARIRTIYGSYGSVAIESSLDAGTRVTIEFHKQFQPSI